MKGFNFQLDIAQGAEVAKKEINGSRLGEVAEHKTSLVLQMFKLKIECQTKH